MDELWSGSENRIFVTFSVSRNARFRGVRGEKELSDRGFVGGFWGANAALLFYALKWYNW